MTCSTLGRSILITSTLLFALGVSAFAQLERCFEAHGGLTKCKSYGMVAFDLAWTSVKGSKQDHELFNLRSREGLITSASYTLGSREGEVWIKPNVAALGGIPPRFYMWTPFYFFGMPFVFADPGAIQEPLGARPALRRLRQDLQFVSQITLSRFFRIRRTARSDRAGGRATLRLQAHCASTPERDKGSGLQSYHRSEQLLRRRRLLLIIVAKPSALIIGRIQFRSPNGSRIAVTAL